MSLFCKVCARMPVDLINKAMERARAKLAVAKVDKSDMKSKAKVFKAVVKGLALEANVDLG